ncbi:outer membrane lipoprotein Blc [Alcanivorax hongdengensis A-11-3]|uniref:Outer membrane lipoprotein Blc n=1 Tax=Alcanivorax hongdengensis A-11-3 TaxID=1177179 RepID=L0WFG7_9GAMM|nr:lipocalin family protein [Alcanivorax hongdengensis]EKF75598.1 outer membrane lipoprotein Blc [Alcanivorax hongdengensis A-11-3]
MRWLIIVSVMLLQACQTTDPRPIAVADDLNLDRFMGDWYVIANIPTPPEKGAHNAVESYQRVGPYKVATTFTFRDGSFDAELKRMTPTGFVSRENPAIWGMRFIWPFKADFRVLYVGEDYQTTIIGRQKRDYVWIMARQPQLSDEQYQALVNITADRGYDIHQLQKVPQQWDASP